MGFKNNPDGAGFSYAEDGMLYVEKGFFSFEEFYERFERVNQLNVPAILHFRKATSNVKTAENCHPWVIDKNHAFIHNGIISKFNFIGSTVSDTGLFVKDFLTPFFKDAPKAWKRKYGRLAIESVMGVGNKGIVLSNTGDFTIYRENLGVWAYGSWFSNYSYLGWINRTVKDFSTI